MPITNETKLTVTRLALKVWTTSISGQGWKTGSLRAQTAKPGPPCRSRPRIRSRRERGDSEGSRRRTSSADEEAEKRNEIIVNFSPHFSPQMVRQRSFFHSTWKFAVDSISGQGFVFNINQPSYAEKKKMTLNIAHHFYANTDGGNRTRAASAASECPMHCSIASLPDIMCRCWWLLLVLWVASNTLQLPLLCQ